MNKFVDPRLFDLPPATKLIQIETTQFDIVIQRKTGSL
jgi:hypothetical protein